MKCIVTLESNCSCIGLLDVKMVLDEYQLNINDYCNNNNIVINVSARIKFNSFFGIG